MSLKRFSDDRYLKIAFVIGGIYDILLGVPLLFFTDLTSTILNVSKPEPVILPQTIGIFLIIIGYFLLIVIQDIRKFIFIGVGSVVIRLSYATLAVLTWLTLEIEIGYFIVAMTDTLTAIILLVPIILTEGVSWKQLWQLQT